eukprot:390849-Rhodomonas_salina.1
MGGGESRLVFWGLEGSVLMVFSATLLYLRRKVLTLSFQVAVCARVDLPRPCSPVQVFTADAQVCVRVDLTHRIVA